MNPPCARDPISPQHIHPAISPRTPCVLPCPHCHDLVLIESVNCAIFRHGVFKDTMQQIPPHASKTHCDHWRNNDAIFGCGLPFRLVSARKPDHTPVFSLEPCDYI